jgi:ABC-type sugar transport system ATPase subunit
MLRLHQIGKSFGPVEVLKDITLEVATGETLGLVGENGAGKSTMMNILGGIIEPTVGEIAFDGKPFQPTEVIESQQSGIAFIHQELNLFPNLSIQENLFINDFPKRGGSYQYFIDQEALSARSERLLEAVGLSISPATPLGNLTNGQQQLVEIAKALSGQPKLIIFDEPTTALSQRETSRLLELIKELKQKQISMIFISHNLDEVKAIADRIAVIRDGKLVRVEPATTYTRKAIIRDMVGRDLEQFFPARKVHPVDQARLQVQELNVDGETNISFMIKEREVVGLYGLVGAGRSEMARGLYGLAKTYGGQVHWNGEQIKKFSPQQWIRRGVVYLTEDRREEGILSFKSIRENVQLASLPRFLNNVIGWLDYTGIKEQVQQKVKATRVKYHDLELQAVSELSGGNQQKVLLSRWLMTEPGLLILDEPTKGIDIGAREEIYQLVNQLVEQGSCALLISSEIEELLGMCDRIMVMNQGAITAEFTKDEFDQRTILKHALKATP